MGWGFGGSGLIMLVCMYGVVYEGGYMWVCTYHCHVGFLGGCLWGGRAVLVVVIIVKGGVGRGEG